MVDSETTIQGLLDWSIKQLSGSESPSLDSRILLAHCLDCTHTYLMTWPEKEVTPQGISTFKSLVAQRKVGHPIAHLTGKRAFWTLDLAVNASTLIPRPETELLVETALSLPLPTHPKVLDLGTGTGAIALALASENPNWQVIGVDKQIDAVQLAIQNGEQANISNASFKQSDWFSAVNAEKFDVIVSNPPYVETSSPYLTCGDVRFEPASALTSGDDGLDDIRLIISKAKHFLEVNGWILLEHGFEQGADVRKLLESHQFFEVTTLHDLNGQPRVTMGRNNI